MTPGGGGRGRASAPAKTSLAHFPSTGPLYLYWLVEDGSLYPVHARPGAPVAQAAVDASWVKDIGALIDAAIQKVSQGSPVDCRAVFGIYLQSRFTATYRALDDMRALTAALQGPKGLLRVTYGIPSTIHLADRTWF